MLTIFLKRREKLDDAYNEKAGLAIFRIRYKWNEYTANIARYTLTFFHARTDNSSNLITSLNPYKPKKKQNKCWKRLQKRPPLACNFIWDRHHLNPIFLTELCLSSKQSVDLMFLDKLPVLHWLKCNLTCELSSSFVVKNLRVFEKHFYNDAFEFTLGIQTGLE